ncbi:hypothetical protein FVEN_g3232 [Fusarium venenatum]|nr:hypothetical protein FVEN_g3232 [Fusarium venenatum]
MKNNLTFRYKGFNIGSHDDAHLIHGPGLENDEVGHILIWAYHLDQIETNLIPDPTVAVARFSNGAQDKTTTAAELRLTANRVAVSISPQTLQKLRSIGAISLSGQLFDIATMLKSRDPVTITMLFTLHVAHHVSVLRNLINSRKDQDRAASPLSRYFAHSPQVCQMNLGHCPLPGSASWPSDVHGLRLYTFAAQGQYLLYSMC